MNKENSNWFTSDCHISHRRIIEYCNRPFKDVEEMNQHIINSWNVIKDGDTLYSLGDFMFGKIGQIMQFLQRAQTHRFNLIMITGNHDQEIIENKQLLLDSGLVKEITTYKEIRIGNQFIVLFHYGCRVWNKSHKNSILLYGHSHSSLPPLGKSVDVGVDSTWITKNGKAEYRPFNFLEIKDFMNRQKSSTEDYHGNKEVD